MRIQKKFQGTIPDNKILDKYSESQTDTYSCHKINEFISNVDEGGGSSYEPNMISLVMTADRQNVSAGKYTKVSFNSAAIIGDKLSKEGDCVKIGKGVEYVKVSAMANPQSGTAGEVYLRIQNGDTYDAMKTITWIFGECTGAWDVVCVIIPPKLIKVTEGQLLSLFVYTPGQGTIGPGNGGETSFTVEVVK